jgi:hypothetical protein
MIGLRAHEQDRGQEDLFVDSSRRDLREDGAGRDFLSDPGNRDLMRDLGVREMILSGPLLTGHPPAGLNFSISSARAGRFALSFRRE